MSETAAHPFTPKVDVPSVCSVCDHTLGTDVHQTATAALEPVDPRSKRLMLVPTEGPDREPRDGALATWQVHEGRPGEWWVSCRWVDEEGNQWGWKAPAERGRDWL